MKKISSSITSSLTLGFTSWIITDNNKTLSNETTECNTIRPKNIDIKSIYGDLDEDKDTAFDEDMTSGSNQSNTFSRRNALKKKDRKRLSKSRSIYRKETFSKVPDSNHELNKAIKHNILSRQITIPKPSIKPPISQKNSLTSRLSISITSKKSVTLFDPNTVESEKPKLQAHVHLTNIKGSRVKERCLFLYKDLLIIGKFKSDGKYKLKERVRLTQAWVDVCEVEATTQQTNDTHKNLDSSLVMGWPGNKNNLVTTFANQNFRDHWFNELISRIKRLREGENVTKFPVKVKHQSQSLSTTKTMLLDNKENSKDFLERCLIEFRINKDSSHYQLMAMNHTEAASRYLDGIETPFYLLITPLSKSSVLSWSSSDTYFLLKENGPKKEHLTSHPFRDRNHKHFFGRPLHELVTNEDKLEPFLMQILEHIYIYGPVTQGIFRKGASPGVKKTKEKLEKGEVCALDNEPTVNLVSLLKTLLKQLPECLLTSQLYQEWMKASTIEQEDVFSTEIKRLLLKLPQSNIAILFLLLNILKHISVYSHQNLMSACSLSTCISQCLLWPSVDSPTSTSQQLNDAKQLNQLIQLMIKLVDELFVYNENTRGIFVRDVSVAKEKVETIVNGKPFGYLDDKVEKVMKEGEEEGKSKKVTESSISLKSTSENIPQTHSKASLSKSTCDISTLKNQKMGLFSFFSDGIDNGRPTKLACTTAHYKSDMSFINGSGASTDIFSSFSSIFESSSSSNNSSPIANSSLEIFFKDPVTNTVYSTVVSDKEACNTRF